MKAKDIFNTAVTLMFGEEADRVDYKPFYINILNILIAENYYANQSLRRMRGKEEMTSIPYITDMEEELEYEDEFTRQILPYGIAGYIYTDDDKSMGSEYKNKYEYEKNKILAVKYEDVTDVHK
jgi:hypothetical protein